MYIRAPYPKMRYPSSDTWLTGGKASTYWHYGVLDISVR